MHKAIARASISVADDRSPKYKKKLIDDANLSSIAKTKEKPGKEAPEMKPGMK